jgi:UDP-N-acetylglucosamine 2-epimerase (non-hydrolysing)
MEAGNRCYDNRVPEEVNRRIIDHSSDILLPYTQRSTENLVAEGIRRERIFVTGNQIFSSSCSGF